MQLQKSIVRGIGGFVGLMIASSAAHADDILWMDPGGGTFQDDGNWIPQTMPGIGDRAIFDLATAGYTVDFNADAETAGASIRRDIVTFDLAGYEYVTSSSINIGSSSGDSSLTIVNGQLSPFLLSIGGGTALASTLSVSGATASVDVTDELQVSGNPGALSIESGATVLDGKAVQIGLATGSVASALITGAGSDLTVTGVLGRLFVGTYGDGTLTVQDGATLATEDARIGMFAGSTGEVTVTGSGSTWTNAGSVIVGWFADGALTISAGGSLTSNGGTLGYEVGSTGEVILTGSGSTWVNTGSLRVGVDGAGILTVTDLAGKTNPDPLIVGGLGTVNVTAGGTMTTGESTIGSGTGTAEVTVSGSGSIWESTGGLSVGVDGAAALTVAGFGQGLENQP